MTGRSPGGAALRAGRTAAVVLAAAVAGGAPRPALAADEPLSVQGRIEWLSAGGAVVPRDTAVNPGNRALRLPAASVGTELRPDLRLEHASGLRAVARPRLWAAVEKARVDGIWGAERRDGGAEWLEAYASWRAGPSLEIAYGLQNFQWGPAELMSPSNRLFHETGFARDPRYAVRGRHLARVNVSRGQAFTVVALAELRPNGEEPFVAGEPFEPKAQVKLEWAAPGGGPYVGFTAGAGRLTRGFLGEYLAVPLGGALSVYADAVHAAGSRAWVPGPDGFAQAAEGSGPRTLALGGVRFTFEGGADLRLEYVFDEAGWSPAQLLLAARVAAAAAAAGQGEALAAYLRPGLELGARQLAYASLRLPDLAPSDRTHVQVGYLAALEDGSGAAFATATFDASDSAVLFGTAIGTHGRDHGTLSRLARGTVVLGAAVTF